MIFSLFIWAAEVLTGFFRMPEYHPALWPSAPNIHVHLDSVPLHPMILVRLPNAS
jgi:hypothetical protein